jgi:hypothetical protein
MSVKDLYLPLLFIAAMSAAAPIFAQEPSEAGKEKSKSKEDSLSWPIMAAGFSYPLILSASAGAMLPLGKPLVRGNIPPVPALRAEAELGLGGASVSAGVYVPIRDTGLGVNLKRSRMRTWIGGLSDKFDGRTYDGIVAEFVSDGHVPGKIGIGYFKERSGDNSRDYRFTSFFVGIGW